MQEKITYKSQILLKILTFAQYPYGIIFLLTSLCIYMGKYKAQGPM